MNLEENYSKNYKENEKCTSVGPTPCERSVVLLLYM
jgi:hypothetical protein